jgi:drug/metabolite transporter (DMT)-like permease
MNFLYLFLAMSFSAMITVGGRLYNTKNIHRRSISKLYSLLTPLAAALFWLVLWIFDFSFELKVLPYAFLYGIFYTLFTIGMLSALKYGSTSLTALIKQVSLVGVSFWGFIFWDTSLTLIGGIGIVLILVSISLCLLTGEEKNETQSLPKWALFALMITVGNAGCSITQRYQQDAFNYEHKNMLMFFGVLFSAIFCLLLTLRDDKSDWRAAIKSSWVFPAIAGAGSVFCNVFILLMVKNQLSPAILYPGVAVGGLMLTVIISLLFFREKLRPMQILGLIVGAVALVLLNL